MSGYQSNSTAGVLIGNLPLGQSLGGYAVATGTGLYLAALNPTIASYQAGMMMKLMFDATNTGPVQINVDGNGLIAAKKVIGGLVVDFSVGEIDPALVYVFVYNEVYLQLINCCKRTTEEFLFTDFTTASLIDGTLQQTLGGPFEFAVDQLNDYPAFEVIVNGVLQFGAVKTIRVAIGADETIYTHTTTDTGEFSLQLHVLKASATTLKVSSKFSQSGLPVVIKHTTSPVLDFSSTLNLTFTGQVVTPSIAGIVKEQFIVKGGRH